MKKFVLLLCLAAPAALAAPRIESLAVRATGDSQVEAAIGIKRGQFDRGGCDAVVDFGDGSKPRRVEFGVATATTVKHAYAKGGRFHVSAKGAGATPCEGAQSATAIVKGPPAKKPAPKKKKGAEAPSSRPTR